MSLEFEGGSCRVTVRNEDCSVVGIGSSSGGVGGKWGGRQCRGGTREVQGRWFVGRPNTNVDRYRCITPRSGKHKVVILEEACHEVDRDTSSAGSVLSLRWHLFSYYLFRDFVMTLSVAEIITN
jgi:hypothetical protein